MSASKRCSRGRAARGTAHPNAVWRRSWGGCRRLLRREVAGRRLPGPEGAVALVQEGSEGIGVPERPGTAQPEPHALGEGYGARPLSPRLAAREDRG